MAKSTAAELAAPDARGTRQRAVADARRSLVLDAARAAFLELGLDGASMREIARRAGYTPGAIYSYYASKEEMYGALLGESLERLNARVAAAQAGLAAAGTRGARAQAVAALRAAAGAFFDFFHEHPRDLDLGFYLFRGGMKPRVATASSSQSRTSYPVPCASSPRSWSRLRSVTCPPSSNEIASSGHRTETQPSGVGRSSSR